MVDLKVKIIEGLRERLAQASIELTCQKALADDQARQIRSYEKYLTDAKEFAKQRGILADELAGALYGALVEATKEQIHESYVVLAKYETQKRGG